MLSLVPKGLPLRLGATRAHTKKAPKWSHSGVGSKPARAGQPLWAFHGQSEARTTIKALGRSLVYWSMVLAQQPSKQLGRSPEKVEIALLVAHPGTTTRSMLPLVIVANRETTTCPWLLPPRLEPLCPASEEAEKEVPHASGCPWFACKQRITGVQSGHPAGPASSLTKCGMSPRRP